MELRTNRLETIDFLRGCAILIMIVANSTPYFFNFSDQIALRYIFSLAAPAFIFLAGYTSQMNHDNGKPETLYRILQILVIGMGIDLFIWRSTPLYTFDVLYLIAISKFILFLINKNEKKASKVIILLLTTGIFYFLSTTLEYRFDNPDLSINDLFNDFALYAKGLTMKRFFYDGWFPLFPWFFFLLLGAILYNYRNSINKLVAIILVVIGIAIGLGFIIYLKDSIIPVREKYFEIWYPLASYKLLIPLSVSFILFGTIQLNAHYQFNFINLLGKNSLFVYLISAFFDSIIEEKQVDQFSSTNKLILLITMTLIIIIMTYLLSVVKKRDLWKKIPKFVKFILGT